MPEPDDEAEELEEPLPEEDADDEYVPPTAVQARKAPGALALILTKWGDPELTRSVSEGRNPRHEGPPTGFSRVLLVAPLAHVSG